MVEVGDIVSTVGGQQMGDRQHLGKTKGTQTWSRVMVEHPGWTGGAGGWVCTCGSRSVKEEKGGGPCGNIQQGSRLRFWYYSERDSKDRHRNTVTGLKDVHHAT